MKQQLLRTGAALFVALFVIVCASEGGLSARKKEKAAVYAALKPWEKKYIERGEVAPGFTPDMVYLAMGKPDKVEAKDLAEGHIDLWTYSRCYPEPLVVHRYRNEKITPDSGYQPAFQAASMQSGVGGTAQVATGGMAPGGVSSTGSGASIGKTGGPQGGTMEPAGPQSYTVQILFEAGKTAKMSCVPNMN